MGVGVGVGVGVGCGCASSGAWRRVAVCQFIRACSRERLGARSAPPASSCQVSGASLMGVFATVETRMATCESMSHARGYRVPTGAPSRRHFATDVHSSHALHQRVATLTATISSTDRNGPHRRRPSRRPIEMVRHRRRPSRRPIENDRNGSRPFHADRKWFATISYKCVKTFKNV